MRNRAAKGGVSAGRPALTRFLTRFALSSQQSNAAATYVDLADDVVVGFYQRFDFIDSPTDPMHLFLLTKDLRRAAGRAA